MTTKISIVYHTRTEHTGSLAQAVADGAQRVSGVQVNMYPLTASQLDKDGKWNDEPVMAALDASDAIIFGCPTYMGSVSSVCKAFMEATLSVWASQGWKDKFAGGFTNSATLSGDKLNSLVDLVVFAAQLGMIWVPIGDLPGAPGGSDGSLTLNRLGGYLGAMAQSDLGGDPASAPPEMDLDTGRRYGERVTQIARRFNGEGEYTTSRVPFGG